MNKYIITSIHFQGEIEATYIDAELALLDFRGSNLSGVFKEGFKSKLAVSENNISVCFAPGTVTILKSEAEIIFDMFWNEYGKKVNPKRCKPLWAKLSKTKQVKAFLGIKKYNKHLSQNTWMKKMDPESYLRDERWEDEY